MQLSFDPTLDRSEALLRLERLLVPGPLCDPALAARIGRLAASFQGFIASYPLPLWAPGLAVDNGMRGLSEALFPMKEVRPVFDLLLKQGCRFTPLLSGTYLHSSACWLDLLQRLRPQLSHADPARTLRELARDDQARTRFLFSLMLPHHYGGGFDRYPQQLRWISSWLRERGRGCQGGIRVLDSACGSGEGTYELAGAVAAAGARGGAAVHGSTLEPMELFAAAHLFFPHDRDREGDYREKVAPLLARPEAPAMEFYLDRVDAPSEREPYHLVLCNGLLGGPLLHGAEDLCRAFAGLASRLAPGGVLLAADRFHAGWRLRVPAAALCDLMRANGLAPLEVPEGIAGERKG